MDKNNIQISPEKIILDTHILIWYLEGIELKEKYVNIIDKARNSNSLYISAISIWEIAMLANKNKIALSVNLNSWIDKLLSLPGINLVDLSTDILLESCALPHYSHKDPADRMIISSTRAIDACLISFDQKIIDYANKGYLKVLDLKNTNNYYC